MPSSSLLNFLSAWRSSAVVLPVPSGAVMTRLSMFSEASSSCDWKSLGV